MTSLERRVLSLERRIRALERLNGLGQPGNVKYYQSPAEAIQAVLAMAECGEDFKSVALSPDVRPLNAKEAMAEAVRMARESQFS